MNFTEFKTCFAGRPLILSRDVIALSEKRQALLNQLDRWSKSGRLLRLRKGVYIFSKAERKIDPPLGLVANLLVEPSYVSLEYALYLYGLIPEMVVDVTSITTTKTIEFSNALGTFKYQHLKTCCFRGFTSVDMGQGEFFLADKEKAFVDFVYLHLGEIDECQTSDFLESYRLDRLEMLDRVKMFFYVQLFATKKLTRVIARLGLLKE